MLRTIRTTCGHIIHVIDLPGRNLLPHSTTGPAFIYPNNKKEYYIYGIKYSKIDWEDLMRHSKIKSEDLAVLESAE